MTPGGRLPWTRRSRMLMELAPTIRRAVRTARLDPADADDALQRALFSLGRRVVVLEELPHAERHAYAWIAGIRAARRQSHVRDARQGASVEPPLSEFAAADGSPEAVLIRRQLGVAIEDALDALDADERAAVVLVLQEELPQAVAAHALAVPRGTLASRLRRAREALRRRFTEK